MPTVQEHSVVLLLAAISGAIVMLSTMLLIGLRRIYVNEQTKQVTEIEFPLLGKMKTQSPALFLVAVGFMLLGYAVYQDATLRNQDATLRSQAMIKITPGTLDGEIDMDGANATVLVLAVPSQYQNARQSSGKFSIPVPLLPDTDYQVRYEVDQQVFPVQTDFANNHIQAHPFHYVHSQAHDELPTNLQVVRKDVSDEELKKLGLTH
jgi:hypothetical protein